MNIEIQRIQQDHNYLISIWQILEAFTEPKKSRFKVLCIRIGGSSICYFPSSDSLKQNLSKNNFVAVKQNDI